MLGQIVHGHPGGGAELVIVILSVACAVCTGLLESVTCTVKLVVPVALGVPEIVPLEEIVRPAGKVDPDAKLQVYGEVPPPAVTVWL